MRNAALAQTDESWKPWKRLDHATDRQQKWGYIPLNDRKGAAERGQKRARNEQGKAEGFQRENKNKKGGRGGRKRFKGRVREINGSATKVVWRWLSNRPKQRKQKRNNKEEKRKSKHKVRNPHEINEHVRGTHCTKLRWDQIMWTRNNKQNHWKNKDKRLVH